MKKRLLSIFVLLLGYSSFSQNSNHETGLATATMASQGIDSVSINKLAKEIESGIYPNIHSLLIARRNKLVYEHYWPGKDQRWGDDMGVVPHTMDSLHDMRSISKSVVSACVGIAIQMGKIKSVNQKIFDFFPEYKSMDTGMKSMLTIKHLLTMTSGLVWNEDVPYDNPENSEIKMVFSASPMKYVLEQPMDHKPGEVWKYNGGTTQLLAGILKKVSGKELDEFAAEYLFKPLGITKFDWVKYPVGEHMPAAASGLRLRSRDLLKFGLLYANNGKWENKQIVPASWVEASLKSYVKRGKNGGYGFQFWLFTDETVTPSRIFIAGVGNGDQRVFIDKKNDLVVVVTAGNYNKWDIEKDSHAMMREYVYPSLK